jgi:hypothetical protein
MFCPQASKIEVPNTEPGNGPDKQDRRDRSEPGNRDGSAGSGTGPRAEMVSATYINGASRWAAGPTKRGKNDAD